MVQEAVEEKLKRLERSRFAREGAELDAEFEKAMAEEGMFGMRSCHEEKENTKFQE